MNIVKEFVKIRSSLEQERTRLQKQLQDIDAALGIEAVQGGGEPLVPFPEVEAAPIRRGPGRPKGTKAKRKLSAAGKARIIAGTKARWAKLRAEKTGNVVVEKAKAPKGKGKMSAAGRAAIIAAQKARWAKVKAEKPGKPFAAPKDAAKPKKFFSAAARARLAAAAKARWAKAKATGKGKL
jgi:hypothetical protein